MGALSCDALAQDQGFLQTRKATISSHLADRGKVTSNISSVQFYRKVEEECNSHNPMSYSSTTQRNGMNSQQKQQQSYEQHDATNAEVSFQPHLLEEQDLGRVPISTFVNVKDDIWVWSSGIANLHWTVGDIGKLKSFPGKPHNHRFLCLVLHSQFRAFAQLTAITPEQKGL